MLELTNVEAADVAAIGRRTCRSPPASSRLTSTSASCRHRQAAIAHCCCVSLPCAAYLPGHHTSGRALQSPTATTARAATTRNRCAFPLTVRQSVPLAVCSLAARRYWWPSAHRPPPATRRLPPCAPPHLLPVFWLPVACCPNTCRSSVVARQPVGSCAMLIRRLLVRSLLVASGLSPSTRCSLLATSRPPPAA